MAHFTGDRYWQAKKATLIGALLNAFLGVIKIVGGIAFHSHALFADGIHSFSDLLTDAMVLFASKYGSQVADDSHPYGHRRIETAATLLLALLLVLTGLGIAWDAMYELLGKTFNKPAWPALLIAFFSIVINELLFHYTQHVGKKIQSALLLANAWHHRSDAASSIVVVLGLIGSFAGFIFFDTVAAILVGALIIKMGLSYAWNSVKELVDTAVEPKILSKVVQELSTFEEIKKIHQLRSRLMGGDIFIDVHILVSPYLSVSEGHYIAQQVHYTLMNRFDRIRDVVVHVDPEDDEEFCPSLHLPSRTTLEKKLFKPWKKACPEIISWTLHYLDGKISIDLELKDCDRDLSALKKRIEEDLLQFPEVLCIKFLADKGSLAITRK